MNRLIILLPVLLSGCSNSSTTIPGTKGASLIIEDKTTKHYSSTGTISSEERTIEKKFIQNENPKTNSTLEISESGVSKLTSGTSYENEIVIPPPKDYTKYIALIAGLIFIIGGACAIRFGQISIGKRLCAYGSVASLVSMTVSSYGAYYTAAILALGAYVCFELFNKKESK